MSEKKRRRWTANEKLRIVLTCLQPGVEVSEVCRREGINPTMFYNWKKRLMASAGQVFEEKPKKRDLERERTERETARLKDVIAEIVTIHGVLGQVAPAGTPRRQGNGMFSSIVS